MVTLSEKIKYLGIIIDKNLTWNSHLDHLENKVNQLISRLNYFSFIKSDLEVFYKKMIYFSVFVPTICYASGTWYSDISDKITYTNRLKVLQNKTIKSLFNVYRCCNTAKTHKLLNIFDINVELRILGNYTLNCKNCK